MSAIITENFRRNNARALINDIADVANYYYVGLGKSNAWPATSAGLNEDAADYNVSDPIGTFGDFTEVKNNLTTLVGLAADEAYSLVIPNIAAKVNHRHKAYNPFDPDCFYQGVVDGILMYPCYTVVNDNVYLCLREATNIETSYSLPSGASQSRAPIENADGSIWIYIYSILPSDPINGTQFVTVPESATLNGVETLSTITAASGNLVYGFTVQDGGSGYVTAPVVEFVGESGTVTTLLATLNGGAVASVTYPLATTPLSWASERGYVRVATGNARVSPNIAPALGFGYSPAADMNSWYVGITVSAVELIEGDGAYIPYRQISILKNPEYEGGTAAPELSLNCLQNIEFDSGSPTSLSTGSVITQAATSAIGIVDYYDSATKKLYYHQSYETGFIPFTVSPVSVEASLYNPIAVNDSEYVKDSGTVIFTENRKKITRVGGQTEVITIILQF